MAVKKGQVFLITAFIISSLFLLVGFSYQGLVQPDQDSDLNDYFDKSKSIHVDSFNDGLTKDKSFESAKRNLYQTNRFMHRRTNAKGIDYGSSQVFILSGEKLGVINYRDSSLDYSIEIDGTWENGTVSSKQYESIQLAEGEENFRVILDDPGVDLEFTASTPRIVNFIMMEGSGELWRDRQLH